MDEIRKVSREINYNKLIYHFTTPGIAPINFIKFKGPFNTFKEIRDSDKTLQEIEEDQQKFKSSLGKITSGNPKQIQQKMFKVFMIQDKKLSIYLIMQKLDLKQNEIAGTGLKIY